MDAVAALAPGQGVIAAACAALGLARASYHRRRRAVARSPAASRQRPSPARALAAGERQGVLDQAFRANPERFVNKPPQPPPKPTAVWINPPTQKLAIQA